MPGVGAAGTAVNGPREVPPAAPFELDIVAGVCVVGTGTGWCLAAGCGWSPRFACMLARSDPPGLPLTGDPEDGCDDADCGPAGCGPVPRTRSACCCNCGSTSLSARCPQTVPALRHSAQSCRQTNDRETTRPCCNHKLSVAESAGPNGSVPSGGTTYHTLLGDPASGSAGGFSCTVTSRPTRGIPAAADISFCPTAGNPAGSACATAALATRGSVRAELALPGSVLCSGISTLAPHVGQNPRRPAKRSFTWTLFWQLGQRKRIPMAPTRASTRILRGLHDDRPPL